MLHTKSFQSDQNRKIRVWCCVSPQLISEERTATMATHFYCLRTISQDLKVPQSADRLENFTRPNAHWYCTLNNSALKYDWWFIPDRSYWSQSENNWNMTYFWATSVSEWDLRFIIKAEVPDDVWTAKTFKKKSTKGLTGLFGRSLEVIELFSLSVN